MNKAKKVLAFVLAVVMCVSLFTTFAFAATGTGDIPAESERPKTAYNIVCIGDEYANGRGLAHYGETKPFTVMKDGKPLVCDAIDNTPDVGAMDACSPLSYVARLGNKLQFALGQGFDVTTTSLCFNGMRAEDFQAVLEKDTGDHYSQTVLPLYEQWFKANMDTLNISNGKMTPNEWDALNPVSQLLAPQLEPYADLQDFMVDKIRNASLITYDLGMNNFGTYLLNRIETAIAWATADRNDPDNYTHFDEDGNPYFGEDYPYYGDDPEAVHGDLVLGSEDMLRLLVDNTLDTLAGIAPESLIKELSNAFLYAFFDYCVSFQKDIAYIRFLAPLSQIIVVGSYNAIDGLKFSIDYPEGEIGQTLDIDLGGFWKTYIGMADAFVVNGQTGTQYKYADVINVDVETLFDELVANKTANVSIDKGFEPGYQAEIAGEVYALALNAVAEGFAKNYAGEKEKYALLGVTSEETAKAFVLGIKRTIADFEALDEDSLAKRLAKNTEEEVIGTLTTGSEAAKAASVVVLKYFAAKTLDDTVNGYINKFLGSIYNSAGKTTSFNPYVISVESISALSDGTSLTDVFTEENANLDPATKTILNLYSHMLAGTDSLGLVVGGPVPADAIVEAPIGTLPSAAGHETKLNAILKSWILPGNADTKGEDVTIGVFESFFEGLTNSFQVPILDTINEAFRNFLRWIPNFFGNFFQSIKDGFNGIFGR